MRSSNGNLDQTLIALADPTRRTILEALSRGEARVTDVAELFAISLNSVSKHIQMLERAGLIRRRVHGREHILSFNVQPFDEATAWMESQRTAWTHRLRALDALLQQQDREQRSRRAKKGGSR